MAEVGRRPASCAASSARRARVFSALAGEQGDISTSVARLPGSLRATERALEEVRGFAPLLRTTLQSLREPIRELPATNAALTPFFEQTTPVLRNQIRPFVRVAQPFANDLRLAAGDLAKATPDLNASLGEVNRFFNMGAHNPNGAEGLGGLTVAQQRERQEGFLYWLAWTAQNGVSLLSSADAQGPVAARDDLRRRPGDVEPADQPGHLRRVSRPIPSFVQSSCSAASGPNPAAGSPIDTLLDTGFGTCNFNSLPTP